MVIWSHVLQHVIKANQTSQNRKLDLLLKNSGIDLRAEAVQAAGTLARAGKKIEAIKVYRELTGVGLAEAKAAVERL